MKAVDVVVAVILDGNRFLVERRKKDAKVDPSIICLLGGHVKVNESLLEALKREMLKN